MKPGQLAPGENVIFSTRAHWKRLVGPVLVTVATVVVGTYLLLEVVPSPQDHAWQRWIIAILGILLLLAFALWPFLTWIGSTDTLTDRRLVNIRGVVSRERIDVPVARVHSVRSHRTLLDRVLGSGTMVLGLADGQELRIRDVAHLERRMLQVQRLLGAEPAAGAATPAVDRPEPAEEREPAAGEPSSAAGEPTDAETKRGEAEG